MNAKNISLIAALLLSTSAGAATVQTLGAGSALSGTRRLVADFEANTALASDFQQGGLLFSYTGSDNNAGCGFAGADCVEPGAAYSAAFVGNYMATSGQNAFISIRSLDGSLKAIELAVDSGYASIHGFWQTFRDGTLAGSGNFSLGEGGTGGSLGLADAEGFDELRYFAFSSAGRSSGFSAPAIDSIYLAAVPEPATAALCLLGLAGLAAVARRQRKQEGQQHA
ncbi:PEP-CTERM sorting domain-containing protein [Paucibacter sp. PLA-PC-4]|uniref:PEP-CTERM sorting domain-containing protein n=1 Tax=Paucibacter sp. PLA-PC-4 TaxID=2993655 RepID=UPI00224AB438|nr:PEP-CTERM sorting domain-containing protein [Paucibacter sp. PLA-PC-4]MCX2865058.1 PEP-CTERM sorting domain-containing protein [Paucibacter sp. PLA-PC-4]